MDAVDRLVAHEEIRQLASRYAVAVDSRDLDGLVALFVGDVQVGRDGRGREALRAAFDASLRAVGVTVLHVGTHVIDVASDGGTATGTVYCRGEVQDGDRWIHQSIVYGDTYAREDGRWRFVRRVHELFYGAEVGRSPLGLPPARWPESAVGWGTVPERWETWRRFWSGS